MKKLLYMLGCLVFFGYLGLSSAFTVKESEYVLVAQFGKGVKTINSAGLYFKLPTPIQTLTRYDKRLQVLKLLPAELGTRDSRNILVENVVFWRISDPSLYQSGIRLREVAEQRLESLVYSEVGAAIGGANFDELFSETGESNFEALFMGVTESANHLAKAELGIEIVSVRPTRTSMPKQNLLAIYKRMESEWTRRAKQLRAEGMEEAEKIKSETHKKARELKAKAYKESQIILGEGEAKAAELYAEAFEKNQEYYKRR